VATLFFAELAISRDAAPIVESPDVAAALEVLDVWIETTRVKNDQPGLSIGIVHDQDLVWTRGYGHADVKKKIPATPATLYRIASISKLFTATSILQLRDAGKLQLDDPIRRHLSWFKIKDDGTDGPVITLRHLLTHTSGLPREVDGVNWNDFTFPDREEMLRVVPRQEMVFPVETEWKYSNLALSLAGEIVAEVSGQTWPDYVKKNIFSPLGMGSSVAAPQPNLKGLAVGYSRRMDGKERGIEPFVEIGAERPAGSIASNVQDLAKFVSFQFRDAPAGAAQILSGSTLREMHRVHWLRPDWLSGWGLGFQVSRVGEQVRVGHGGALPGHRTQVSFSPEDKIGVIILTNADDGNPGLYLDQAFSIVGKEIAKAVDARKPAAEPDPAWRAYVGNYTAREEDMQILIVDGKLVMVLPDDENPWESRMTLRPVKEHTFLIVPTDPSYWANGELLSFHLNSAGKVERAALASYYWNRK
jgi:CubicO group peptidase (beta-lactamase class C family)